jgi:hypothetical protein
VSSVRTGIFALVIFFIGIHVANAADLALKDKKPRVRITPQIPRSDLSKNEPLFLEFLEWLKKR